MYKKLLSAIALASCITQASAVQMSMPSTVNSYPALTTTQMSVSKAYLAMFGRAPDLGGLNYWSGLLGANATVEQAVNLIANRMGGANYYPINFVAKADGTITDGTLNQESPTVVKATTCDMNNPSTWPSNFMPPSQNGQWDEFVEYIYAFILGKAAIDDMSGVNYWQCQARNGGVFFKNPGKLVSTLLDSASQTGGTAGDKFKNKMTMLEAASRLQLGRGRELGYQDTQTIIRRVTETANSFNDAFTQLDRLTNGTASVAGPRWETPGSGSYTPTKVLNEATPLPGGGYIHKYVVWYNRAGRMMLANVFLPYDYASTSTNYPAIVSVHGGAWTGGFAEKNQRYNTVFAQNSGAPFIVFSPAYALVPYTYKSPEQQNDVDDFITLVKSQATKDAFRVDTNQVNLFGLSAGGHLLNLLGSQKALGKVATLYPVSDLDTSLSTLGAPLIPFVNMYLNGVASSTVSPTKIWVNNSEGAGAITGTKFYIQHGSADTLVYPSQSTAFSNTVNSKGGSAFTCILSGGGHGFHYDYAAVNTTLFNTAAANAISFFRNGTYPASPCQ